MNISSCRQNSSACSYAESRKSKIFISNRAERDGFELNYIININLALIKINVFAEDKAYKGSMA